MISHTTRLALLLGVPLGPDAPPLLRGAALRRVLAWAALQDGPPDLASAPGLAARAAALPGRAARLDGLLRGWEADGVWVLGEADPGFPRRLKRRLRAACPALLFGTGDPSLPGRGGIALVAGARADRRLLASAREALEAAGMTAILDQARDDDPLRTIALGPDGTLATGMLETGTLETGMLATGTLAPGVPARTRIGLLPPGQPAGRSDPQRAAACRLALADAALLSGLSQGEPAWDAAIASLAEDRLPLWVSGDDPEAQPLVRAGARLLPPGPVSAAGLLRTVESPMARRGRARPPAPPILSPAPSLAPSLALTALPVSGAPASGFAEAQAPFDALDRPASDRPAIARGAHLRVVGAAGAPPSRARIAGPDPAPGSEPTLFELFARRLRALLSSGPLGTGPIADALELTRPQTQVWLMRLLAEGQVAADPRTGLHRWRGAASDQGHGPDRGPGLEG